MSVRSLNLMITIYAALFSEAPFETQKHFIHTNPLTVFHGVLGHMVTLLSD